MEPTPLEQASQLSSSMVSIGNDSFKMLDKFGREEGDDLQNYYKTEGENLELGELNLRKKSGTNVGEGAERVPGDGAKAAGSNAEGVFPQQNSGNAVFQGESNGPDDDFNSKRKKRQTFGPLAIRTDVKKL